METRTPAKSNHKEFFIAQVALTIPFNDEKKYEISYCIIPPLLLNLRKYARKNKVIT